MTDLIEQSSSEKRVRRSPKKVKKIGRPPDKKPDYIDTSWHQLSYRKPDHGQRVEVLVHGKDDPLDATFWDSETYWKRLSHEQRKTFISLANYIRMNGKYRFVGKNGFTLKGIRYWRGK